MKRLLGWVSDPIFHLAIVGILVFLFLRGGAGVGAGENSAATESCSSCDGVHNHSTVCAQYRFSTMNR